MVQPFYYYNSTMNRTVLEYHFTPVQPYASIADSRQQTADSGLLTADG